MLVKTIVYHEQFVKAFRKLPPDKQKQAIKSEKLFRLNPLHPSLRLHRISPEAHDIWSISATSSLRILFKRMPDATIFFLKIGSHNVYRNL
ncbi:MAG: plasmid stabilization protein [Patescibacteria group bacterium]